MCNSYDKLTADIEKVRKMPMVPAMLEVICRTTGMGFAAVARVTESRWIACSVRDEVQFGLVAGGELEIGTTICNEIRQSGKAVVIDHVAESGEYCNHHTPKMYGLQSYISMPIFLKTGEFFGTLCAIDPRPASLNNTHTISMFELFADLISFHLQSMDLIEQSSTALHSISRQLHDSMDENRQYHYISNHSLQEPLRKMRLFSNMLLNAADNNDVAKTKELALKIDSGAQKISTLINDLSAFSDLNYAAHAFELVDLNKVVADVCSHLQQSLDEREALVSVSPLPSIEAIPAQVGQLFYHLVSNAVKFARNVPLTLKISAVEAKDFAGKQLSPENGVRYIEINVEDNGIGIERSQLDKIFDIFAQLPDATSWPGFGVGLAYCRKIIRNHNGSITAQSEPGQGTVFSLLLPVTH